MNICTVSNLRTLIILSKYAKRKGKLSMAALRRSLGGTQTQDFMFPWLRMASVSVLHFMTERQIWHSTYIQISLLSVNLMFTHYKFNIPYARHHNLLLLTNHSWILTVYKDRIFWKNLLENNEMDYKNRVRNIQTAGYNSVRTVWQYGLWSFQTGGIKIERFLTKNQHTKRKFLNFENWTNGLM